MCLAAAQATGRKPEDFAVASTGVIGQTINIAAIQAGMPALAAKPGPRRAPTDAARAIMTTDTVKKELAVSFTLGGKEVHPGCHRQGLRHDPPQHGHHALLHHHRLRHHPRDAGGRSAGGSGPHLQPGDGGRGHLHQRHVSGPGQRYGGQPPHRVEGRGLLRLPGRPGGALPPAGPLHCRRRRGGQQAGHLHG